MRKWLSGWLYRLAYWLAPDEEPEHSDPSEFVKQYRAEFIAAFERDESLLRQARWPAEVVGTSIKPSE